MRGPGGQRLRTEAVLSCCAVVTGTLMRLASAGAASWARSLPTLRGKTDEQNAPTAPPQAPLEHGRHTPAARQLWKDRQTGGHTEGGG